MPAKDEYFLLTQANVSDKESSKRSGWQKQSLVEGGMGGGVKITY
jgi:hypothetical protein